ncbi:hypothetical protein [Lancefieldella rimae]|uniref:hypothetical protein n=1 Tax=Lancefieldella rimae TaxID=1383 RepID=UPI001CB2E6E3|nr:hypothetical protein [Lancefieldella rimae]MBF4803720.1 hypothetical protein [Lancefieldella rimae]
MVDVPDGTIGTALPKMRQVGTAGTALPNLLQVWLYLPNLQQVWFKYAKLAVSMAIQVILGAFPAALASPPGGPSISDSSDSPGISSSATKFNQYDARSVNF